MIVSPGAHLSYHLHNHRTVIWTIIEGKGELVLDDEASEVQRGDVAVIKPGMKHSIKGITELHIIEMQLGDGIVADDTERFDWDWE